MIFFVCAPLLIHYTPLLFPQHGAKKNVAVKIFTPRDVNMNSISISELLELSMDPRNMLYAYRDIRQEVSFLSNLDHQHLTKLYGVRTSPYMCLVLELAPKKNLRAILMEYKECGVALEPLTLKNTTLQVCMGIHNTYQLSSDIVRTWIGF